MSLIVSIIIAVLLVTATLVAAGRHEGFERVFAELAVAFPAPCVKEASWTNVTTRLPLMAEMGDRLWKEDRMPPDGRTTHISAGRPAAA